MANTAASTPSGQADRPGPTLRSLLVDRIQPAPEGQIRQTFDPAALQTLADSLKRSGLREPVIVVPVNDNPGHYRIVAGERRWRAARLAGIVEIPCLVDEGLSDPKQRLLAQAEENLHRQDLNAVEEAAALVRLMEAFGMDAEAVGALVGRSYQQVRRLVQIHEAPQPVKDGLVSGHLDPRAALELVRIHNKLAHGAGPKGRQRALLDVEELIDRVVNERWTIRRLERYATALGGEDSPEAKPTDARPAGAGAKPASPPPLPAAVRPTPWKNFPNGIFIDSGRIDRAELSPQEYETLINTLEDLLMRVRKTRTIPDRWRSPRG
jgi:ParB family chromosome partitioning protein